MPIGRLGPGPKAAVTWFLGEDIQNVCLDCIGYAVTANSKRSTEEDTSSEETEDEDTHSHSRDEETEDEGIQSDGNAGDPDSDSDSKAAPSDPAII